MKRAPASLQARALGWLAQREQSRSELRRKLMRMAQRQQRAAAAEAAGQADSDAEAESPDPAALAAPIDALLDQLQAQGLLSEERFIEGRVRVRAVGQGTRRIQSELAQHGLKLPPQSLQALQQSEAERAMQLWQRKFGQPAADLRQRARQMRFLAARGFSGATIRAVLAAAAEQADNG
jgi:regulatory protein